MTKPSSIDRLPPDVRKALEAWLRDPALTQAEATSRVNALLEDLDLGELRLSRHAVHRHDRRMQAAVERALQTRQIAKAWTAKFGSAPDVPADHLVIEILRALAFDLASRLQYLEIDDQALPGVVQTVYKITLIVESLERSSEIAARRDRDIKRQAAEEAAAKTPSESKRAISPERLREIIRESYGA